MANLKSGVNKPSFYDPEVNRSYAKMAAHYEIGILPARPRKPRDKAAAEAGVRFPQSYLLGRMRHRTFFSLAECNGAIGEALERMNNRPRRRLGVSRRHLFENIDRPALKALPEIDWEFAEWRLARRFHCDAVLCGQRIFAERFDEKMLVLWARGTARLDHIVHSLGLALGGRPAASFARRPMLPVSNDTLLRVVRRRKSSRSVRRHSDWHRRLGLATQSALWNDHLERRKTIALLPDREPATAEAWLSGQRQISIVARDRGGGYALAAAKALPEETQVADRSHFMENASRAFLDAVRKSMRQIRSAIGAATINPELLTAAERLQYDGYLRREEGNAIILRLAEEHVPIKEIVRRTGHSRGLVRKVLRGQRSDIFRVRESSLELYLPWLRVSATARNCGGVSRAKVSVAVSAWSANGQDAGDAPKRPTLKPWPARPLRGRSQGS